MTAAIMPPALAAHVARVLDELVPCDCTWVLNVVAENGSFETVSTLPPRLAKALMEGLIAAWSPEAVDNLR